MLTFERTEDTDYVREILTTPKCWRILSDDNNLTPDRLLRDDMRYIVARDKGRTVALFVLELGSAPGRASVHFCFLPESWGRATTIKTGTAFLEWVWRTTSLNWLMGGIPKYNRLAIILAKACGFTFFCEERGMVSKDRKKYDLVILQIRRPEYV